MTQTLDPQVAAVLQAAAAAGLPPWYLITAKEARRQYLDAVPLVRGEPPAIAGSEDRTVALSGRDIPVRIYTPDAVATPAPAFLYLHGGGWVVGDLDSHDHVCRWLCAGSGCVIIAVDYRLSPEHKFPAAVDDAWEITRWLIKHAGELGIDNERLGIGGDSAGGNLTAVTTIKARDAGITNITCQVMIYPATDMTMSHASQGTYGEGYRLTRPAIASFITHYLRDGHDMLDWRASPLYAENFSDLPPALVITAGFDPLRDEGEAYANKLKDAGVEVTHECYEGMIHGFIGMPGVVDQSRATLERIGTWIKEKSGSDEIGVR